MCPYPCPWVLGGHGCHIIGNIIGGVTIFEYMGAIWIAWVAYVMLWVDMGRCWWVWSGYGYNDSRLSFFCPHLYDKPHGLPIHHWARGRVQALWRRCPPELARLKFGEAWICRRNCVWDGAPGFSKEAHPGRPGVVSALVYSVVSTMLTSFGQDVIV